MDDSGKLHVNFVMNKDVFSCNEIALIRKQEEFVHSSVTLLNKVMVNIKTMLISQVLPRFGQSSQFRMLLKGKL